MIQSPERFDRDDDRDLVHWFDALGPPPEGQVSPHLRTKVLTQIEQRRARRRLWRWLPQGHAPAWCFAFAAALLLSVGLHVWWGGYARSTLSSWDQEVLQTYRFLQDIQHPKELGGLVATRSTFGEHFVGLGFAPQHPRILFFRLGTLYADALAALHGDAAHVAAPRLDALRQMLERLQAPDVLVDYLRALQTLNRERPDNREKLAKFLALFEALYQVEYATDEPREAAVLFQLGAWLENMALAAAAHDTTALRQEAAIGHFQIALRPIEAPQEVLHSLKRLRHYVSVAPMTDHDIEMILTLVRETQQILGES